jgi:hypothetical protein
MTSSRDPFANQTSPRVKTGAKPTPPRTSAAEDGPLRLTSLGERVAALLSAEHRADDAQEGED